MGDEGLFLVLQWRFGWSDFDFGPAQRLGPLAVGKKAACSKSSEQDERQFMAEIKLSLQAAARSLWLESEFDGWLYRRHVSEFSKLSAPENDALYHQLCTKISKFEILPQSTREGSSLVLPVEWRGLRIKLNGTVESEWISAARGERRSHLLARFPLSAGWELDLQLFARQELISGRVRLNAEFCFRPGHGMSFRWMILARALRWAISENLNATAVEPSRASRPDGKDVQV